MRVDQEALKQSLLDFINSNKRLFRIKVICGWGKSYVIANLMANTDQKYIYCTVDHRACENFCVELIKHGIDHTHFWGKKNEKNPLCAEPRHAYYPGCIIEGRSIGGYIHTPNGNSICPQRDACLYHRQDRTKRVLVTTFEDLELLFDEARIVILDESPEKLLIRSMRTTQPQVRTAQEDHLLIGTEFDEIPASKPATKVYPDPTRYNHPSWDNTVDVNAQWSAFERGMMYIHDIPLQGEHSYVYYPRLSINFEVHNEETHMLANFFNTTVNQSGIPREFGYIDCYGRSRYIIPPLTRKVIFSCATTPIPLHEEMLGVADESYICDLAIENPIIRVAYTWTKSFALDHLEWFKNLVLYLKNDGKRVFIATKKEFAVGKEGTDKTPEAGSFKALGFDTAWFGYGRGFNDFNKEYDYIFVYGSYHYPPDVVKINELCGITRELSEQMCESDVTQTLMRARMFMHPKTPVILMTNKNILQPTITVSLRSFEMYLQGINTNDGTGGRIPIREFKKAHKCCGETYSELIILEQYI
jgi:hypothetical protein